MSRVLCPECLQSFEPAELSALGARLLCASCLAQVRRRADLERRPHPVPAAPPFLRARHAEILAWCRGRWWGIRLPLLLWFALILCRQLASPLTAGGHGYSSFWFGLNIGIHEFGHYLFAPFGDFMHVLGGSLLQCLVPVISMGMFWRQRDFFAIAVCFGWLGDNLFGVARYMADARALQNPLIAPGVGLIPPGSPGHSECHDWHVLFQRMGLLRSDLAIAAATSWAAAACLVFCLLSGGWLLFRMARPASTLPPPPGGWPRGSLEDD